MLLSFFLNLGRNISGKGWHDDLVSFLHEKTRRKPPDAWMSIFLLLSKATSLWLSWWALREGFSFHHKNFDEEVDGSGRMGDGYTVHMIDFYLVFAAIVDKYVPYCLRRVVQVNLDKESMNLSCATRMSQIVWNFFMQGYCVVNCIFLLQKNLSSLVGLLNNFMTSILCIVACWLTFTFFVCKLFVDDDDDEEEEEKPVSASTAPNNGGKAKACGTKNGAHIHLWQFLKELLASGQQHGSCIRWLDQSRGVFKIEDSVRVARLWGIRKNRPAMNYDKLSRSIRQYYRKGIMRKTERSQRLVYQFCHPYGLWWVKSFNGLDFSINPVAKFF